jgi:hypothetical protein
LEVIVQAGAGTEAGFLDSDYVAKGAKIVATRSEVFAAADIITQMLSYGSNDQTGRDDLPLFRRGQVLIGFFATHGFAGNSAGDCRFRRDFVFGGVNAAHDTRAEHGRAVFDGHHLRLQGRGACR